MLQQYLIDAMMRELSGRVPNAQQFYAKSYISPRLVPEEKLGVPEPVGRYVVSALRQEQVDTAIERLEHVARRFCGWEKMAIEGVKQPGESFIDISIQSRPDFAEQAMVSARRAVAFAFWDARVRCVPLETAYVSTQTINVIIGYGWL